jgi:hypothetical protein
MLGPTWVLLACQLISLFVDRVHTKTCVSFQSARYPPAAVKVARTERSIREGRRVVELSDESAIVAWFE